MIMKTRYMTVLALAALLAGGCWQKSVHPFYTERDLVTDPGLARTWTERKTDGDNKDANRWTFTDNGTNGYLLQARDGEGQTRSYDARLFKFESTRFLDIVSRDRSISMMPVHHLFKVNAIGQTFEVCALNTEWVHDWIVAHPDAVPHLKLTDPEHPEDRQKDDYVLTAETKQLQKFVREHLKDEKFFVDPTTFESAAAGGN